MLLFLTAPADQPPIVTVTQGLARIRLVGDIFEITSPYEFSPYWMQLIDAPPANWVPLMRDYVPVIDQTIARPVDPREAAEWAATQTEPGYPLE